MAGGVVSRFYWALTLAWLVFMAGHMWAGTDWHFDAVMGMLCLVLSRLYEKR